MPPRPPELHTASDVDALDRWLYPGLPPVGAGLVQPVAVVDVAPATHVLAAGPEAPRTPLDALALALVRARVDAILTSGRNLRDEPHETYRLHPALADAFGRYRREVARRAAPPHLAVLTTGRDLDLAHPAFSHPGGATVLTGPEAAGRLAPLARPVGVSLVALDPPSVEAALSWLRGPASHALVSIEAGPSVSRRLYAADAPHPLDELALTTWLAAPPPSLRGPAFVPRATLERALPRTSAPHLHHDGHGTWRFERRRRAP